MASFNASDPPPSYFNVAGQSDKQQQVSGEVVNLDNKNPYEGTVYNEMPSAPQFTPNLYNVQPSGVYVVVGPQQPLPAGQSPMILVNGRPEDYLCWSIFTVLCCNTCCLGWIALYFSIKSRSASDNLNMDSALTYSRKAKSMNEKLLAVGIVLFVLSLVFEIFKQLK